MLFTLFDLLFQPVQAVKVRGEKAPVEVSFYRLEDVLKGAIADGESNGMSLSRALMSFFHFIRFFSSGGLTFDFVDNGGVIEHEWNSEGWQEFQQIFQPDIHAGIFSSSLHSI